MAIDAVSSSSNLYSTNATQNNFQQIRKLLEQLGQELQSGDLSGAQNTFSSLQQLLPSSSANQAQTTQQTNQNTFMADLNALGQALNRVTCRRRRRRFQNCSRICRRLIKGITTTKRIIHRIPSPVQTRQMECKPIFSR